MAAFVVLALIALLGGASWLGLTPDSRHSDYDLGAVARQSPDQIGTDG